MTELKDKKLKLLQKIVQKATVSVELYTETPVRNKHLCFYSYFLVVENIRNDCYPFEFVYFVKDITANPPLPIEWKMFTSSVVVTPTRTGEYEYGYDWTNFDTNNNLHYDQKSFIKQSFTAHLKELVRYITKKTSFPWGTFFGRDIIVEGGYEVSMFLFNQIRASIRNNEANEITDIESRKYKTAENNTLGVTKQILENMGKTLPKNDKLTVQNIELDGAFRISFT